MADPRRPNAANADLPVTSSSSLWSASSRLQARSPREPVSPVPEDQVLHSTLQGSAGISSGTGTSMSSSAVSSSAVGGAIKGRHAFQHHESHRGLLSHPSGLSPDKEGEDDEEPSSSSNPSSSSAAPSAPRNAGLVEGNTIVRVDSKDRWKTEGWYTTTVQASASRPAALQRLMAWVVPNQALLSGVAYCVSSCSMILLNKLVLSGYKWEAQISLMLYQNLVSVTVVLICSLLGLIQVEPLTWRLVAVWFPVNIIFVGMLITSFFSLQYMQVAMVTILKNVTNLLTAVGEMYLFRKRHSLRVWGSLILMIVSAICGGVTDLSFHRAGYTWQGFNCLFTAAYSLVLRRVMDVAKGATRTGTLSEFSMVLLNNALSFPPAILMLLLFGEMDFMLQSPLMLDVGFWVICTLSGLLGLAISFTSMWFLHQTSPTTYSLVGSLNKIPLSILGIIIFNAPTSIANVSSILFGCFAGVVFARAKMAG